MRRESDLGHARVSLSRGSLSGDLLGKFSSIVRPRRTSHAGDNNGGADGPDLYDDCAVDPSSWSDGEGATPSASKGFGFMRRFSRATTPFAVVAEESSSSSSSSAVLALRRLLEHDEPERQRRYDLEVMSFSMLHEHFQPRAGRVPERAQDDDALDDNQVEEELHRAMASSGDDDSDLDHQEEEPPTRRKSREATTDADEYAALHDDEDRALLLLRLKSRADLSVAAFHDDEDDDDDDDNNDDDDDDELDEEYELDDHHARAEDDGELNFDGEHLPSSVRKLVRQIENASFLDGNDAVASGASNQDEEDQPQACATSHDRDVRVPKDHFIPRLSDPLVQTKAATPARRTTYPLVVTHANHFGAPPAPPSVPFLGVMGQSCYIPMDEVQEDLTKSVRRLVIGLKQEAEADRHQETAPFTRRRGNSCPQPYCSPPRRASAAVTRPEPFPSTSAPAAMPPMLSSAAAVDITLTPTEPPRWRKRSTLARLAPKFLDTFRRKRKSYLYTDEELESIEGARWKIVELAFRYGGKHRAYLVQAVNMFFPLIKYGRHGGPHPTRLHCNRCGTLQWQHKRGGLSEAVDLADVLQIIDGRQTAVFRKYVSCHELDSRSLSLIFKDRTLDLETQSASHRDWLMSALRTLVAYAKKQRQAEHRAIAEHALLPLDDLGESSPLTQSRAELLARMNAPDGSNVGSGHGGPVMLW